MLVSSRVPLDSRETMNSNRKTNVLVDSVNYFHSEPLKLFSPSSNADLFKTTFTPVCKESKHAF